MHALSTGKALDGLLDEFNLLLLINLLIYSNMITKWMFNK